MRETGKRQENILEVRDLQLAFLGVNGRVEALRILYPSFPNNYNTFVAF